MGLRRYIIVTKENRPHSIKCGLFFYWFAGKENDMGLFGGEKNGNPYCPGGKPKPRPPRPCRRDDAQLFGIILVILGAVTIGAFVLPSKIWLIVLGAVMVFLGIRLVL